MGMNDKSTKKSKTGLREIASVAQVSIATVSRVLNGNSRVDADLRKNVLAAAADLDIDFSQRNKSRALAFLLSNRPKQHVFHSSVLLGAEAFCAAHGWELIVQSSNYPAQIADKELHPPNLVQRRDIVRGALLAGTNSRNLLDFLTDKGVPFVVLGNNVVGDVSKPTYDMVFSDDIQGGCDATRYLLGLGHRNICYVGNTGLPWFARCYEGYRRVMEEVGLPAKCGSVDSEDETEIGYIGTKSLLSNGERVTAIFAGTDPTAHGVYKAIRDSGLEIPDDISVVGCDDTVGSWLHPALTTIREFPEQLGKRMVQLLLTRIANPGQEPQQITLPTELIKRDSCRAIGGAAELPAAAAVYATKI
jgi:DNA-binding LacI/PurR family transcriptional regulator